MSLTKFEVRVIENLLAIMVGFLLIFIPMMRPLSYGLLLFVVGDFLVLLFGMDTLLALTGKSYPKLRRNNNKGVVWLWAVGICTLIMAAIVYFIFRYPLDLILRVVQSNYTFTGVMGSSLTLCLQIVYWLLGFCVFGVILWILVNSNRRENLYG